MDNLIIAPNLINKIRLACNYLSYKSSKKRKFSTFNEKNIKEEISKLSRHKLPVLPRKPKSTGEPLDFIDYKRVICSAGNGGNGLISFLREKNLEFGGPDGGNGGNGGHIIFKADPNISDLSQVNFFLRAEDGVQGHGKCCHGKNGAHLYVSVPLNTIIKKPSTDELRQSKDVIHELNREGDVFIGARGGAGGHGNAFYVSNMIRKPLKAEEGGRGEKACYDIEMGMIATAGFVGFPNAGKSTLLRAISRAKPKVAAYPFTTLRPSIGMVQYGDCFQVAVADIPGIVEGAHRNEGLGFSFLRHIVRCECILFVLDHTQGDLQCQLEALSKELELYDPELLKKKSAVIVNKIDLAKNQIRLRASMSFQKKPIFYISGKYRTCLEPMLIYLRQRQEQFLIKRKIKIDDERKTMMI